MYNLQGKVALVTGAASKRGMGHGVATCLARNGADVAVNDVGSFGVRGRTQDDIDESWRGLEGVVAEIKALGQNSIAIEADITSYLQVEQMVKKCVSEFGKIDILVNNAGVIGPRMVSALDISDDEWNRVLSVNIMGTYHCAKAVAKRMIEQGHGGKIINFASMNGKFVNRIGFGPYSVSKFGVIGLTQVLAYELANYRINVNAVCPGVIATELSGGAHIRRDMKSGMTMEQAMAKAWPDLLGGIPLGRVAQPEEISNLVAFLACPDSDYMTGQAINFTGGMLMCH